VSNQSSIQSAATLLSKSLGSSKLYAIVNNAGTGFSHGTSPAEILDTNTRGPKRVVDAFLPLLESNGRIVNVGSGAGPMFFDMLETGEKKKYIEPMEEGEIEKEISRIEGMNEGFAAYSGSKALLACYTLDLAKKNPNLMISIITPGELLSCAVYFCSQWCMIPSNTKT
jgi:carbonyl reductase 1